MSRQLSGFETGEGISHILFWEKNVPGRGGQKAEVCLVFLGNTEEVRVAGALIVTASVVRGEVREVKRVER